MTQRVGVDVQDARGVLDAHALVEERAQRFLELHPEAFERREVTFGERVAERLVGEDRGADREVRERERALLSEGEGGLEGAGGAGEAAGELVEPGGRGVAGR